MSLVPRWVHFMLMHSIVSDFPKSCIIAFSHLKTVQPAFPHYDAWCSAEQALVQTIRKLWDFCCCSWSFLFPWSNVFTEQMSQSASCCLVSSTATPAGLQSHRQVIILTCICGAFCHLSLVAVNEKPVLLGFTGAVAPTAFFLFYLATNTCKFNRSRGIIIQSLWVLGSPRE